jgi:hypothetical protein
MSVREIQAGLRSNTPFSSNRLMTWNATSANLPDEFSFHHVLPTLSRDGRLLPPTFDSRLSGIPGFRVSVKWTISVTVTRTRSNPLSLFRRTTRCVDLRCHTNPLPYLLCVGPVGFLFRLIMFHEHDHQHEGHSLWPCRRAYLLIPPHSLLILSPPEESILRLSIHR